MAGEPGVVSDALKRDLGSGLTPRTDVCLYACGPYEMLRAVAGIAGQYSIRCQVLMEERMACGLGACLSCTCQTISPDGTVDRKRICRDGPVFSAAEIKWRD